MIADYIKIARIDHWFKNIFVLPGTILAIVFTNARLDDIVVPILVGLVSTCLVASANYVLNEWLDAEFDKHHPLKKNRPSAAGRTTARYVYFEYTIIACAGLTLASSVSQEFFNISVVLLIMGILYNVEPFRTKDRVFLDVLSESINNPLRFLLGWFAVARGVFPPSSTLLAYWMGGAFLMAVKRYAEYRYIGDPEIASRYRKSFSGYTEEKLLVSSFFYALSSAFFLAIFLIKYRIEFLLSFPLFALLFAWYLAIGMRSKSPTQNPEKLYRETKFVAFVIFVGFFVVMLLFIDIPWLQVFVKKLEY